MAKSLFPAIVPVCTLSTHHEGKVRTMLYQAFLSAITRQKDGPMYVKG